MFPAPTVAQRRASAVAFDRQPPERGERGRIHRDRRQRVAHSAGQRIQSRARGGHPDQRGEGGLGLRRVLAGGLAQRRALAFDVEQVVADLEREPERVGETVQCIARRSVGTGRSIAVMIGKSAAQIERNTNSRMTSAARMPMMSEASDGIWFVNVRPPVRTVSPAPEISRANPLASRAWLVSLKTTRAKAV